MPGGEAEALTNGVRVHVESRYYSERSNPLRGQYFFLYTIRITNESDQTVQLQSRHWIITDAEGRSEQVEGPGVVGKQPILEPGGSFEYTSGCHLGSPFGAMRGTYQMVTREGDTFRAEIPSFELSQPPGVH